MSSITRFQFEQMQARLNRPSVPPESEPKENHLHKLIMDHCERQWPRWKYIHSRMDKRTRNVPGVPDFIIALPQGKTIYVEVKRPGEKLSLAQQTWDLEMARLGHTVHVVHTLDEFLNTAANPPPI